MILLTGGSGQLGSAFRALLPDAHAPGRGFLDLTRPAEMAAVVRDLAPSGIINCAAYTAVDAAEDDETTATAVNGTAVGVLAAESASLGIPFVTFSTDYVFDGTAATPYLESSAPNPLNAYGRTKLLGEQAALAVNPDALVIRTSWVFSATHRNFVSTMVGLAAVRNVDVVDDQTGCPTFAPDLAAAALQAMARGAAGLLHLTNQEATTWCQLARAACTVVGIDPERIQPIPSEQYPTRAQRPRFSVLGSERRESLGVDALRPWREALPEALGVRPAAGA